MIALYCEMKPSREESKTLIFFSRMPCVCAPQNASQYHQCLILERLWAFWFLKYPGEKDDVFIVSPYRQLLRNFSYLIETDLNLQMGCVPKVRFLLFSFPGMHFPTEIRFYLIMKLPDKLNKKACIHHLSIPLPCADPWGPTNRFPQGIHIIMRKKKYDSKQSSIWWEKKLYRSALRDQLNLL